MCQFQELPYPHCSTVRPVQIWYLLDITSCGRKRKDIFFSLIWHHNIPQDGSLSRKRPNPNEINKKRSCPSGEIRDTEATHEKPFRCCCCCGGLTAKASHTDMSPSTYRRCSSTSAVSHRTVDHGIYFCGFNKLTPVLLSFSFRVAVEIQESDTSQFHF